MNSCVQTETGCRFDFGPLASTYDRWYTTPEGMAHDRAQKADVLRLLGETQKGARLLDVGCGTGHWSRFFAALGYTVVAVDVCSEMLQAAHRQCAGETAFQTADAGALPFCDGSFDVAVAMATLEFVVSAPAALGEMARCVRKEGRMVIGTLNRCASLNQKRIEEGREPYASARLYSAEELRELLLPFGRLRVAEPEPDEARGSWDAPFLVAEVQR